MHPTYEHTHTHTHDELHPLRNNIQQYSLTTSSNNQEPLGHFESKS